MKVTEYKKQIIQLLDDKKYKEAMELWKEALLNNKSNVISQHIFNSSIYNIALNDWNGSYKGNFERIYQVICYMLNNEVFSLLCNYEFMFHSNKSLGCLKVISVAILSNEDSENLNEFLKEIYKKSTYEEFKNIIENCFFQHSYRFVTFKNLESKDILKECLIESDLLKKEDRVLFTQKINNYSGVQSENTDEIVNSIEEYWDDEEIKFELAISLLNEDILENKLNLIRIFTSDMALFNFIYKSAKSNKNNIYILMLDDRFRKRVLDRIFLDNEDVLIKLVIHFIYKCYEIKKQNAIKFDNIYDEIEKCVAESYRRNIDIIENTISEMFAYKSKNILKFFLTKGYKLEFNERILTFEYINDYNKSIFDDYLRYRIESLHLYIDTQEQYYEYIVKILPFTYESYEKKKSLIMEAYEYFFNHKEISMVLSLINGVLQNNFQFAKEIIIDLITKKSDNKFQIVSYYNPKKMCDVFGSLYAYFKYDFIYELLMEKSLFKNRAFKDIIEYFEYTLSFKFDWSVNELIYKKIFFVTDDLDKVFSLYEKYIDKIYAKHQFFYELEYIAQNEKFTGKKREQIIKGFSNLYYYLEKTYYVNICNLKNSIEKYFQVNL